ncbi:YkgJ family cysteine cluster protein [Candidatus Parcubacteria bacterium]|nr:YkgJ family cysteine cluster protein [Candidatus Parcubacteria bacterium]
MKKIIDTNNICLRLGCSECCNPVKINSRQFICAKKDKLPFVELGEIFIPEMHSDYIKLKTYRCVYFNSQTGLCDNYFNRPAICQNTKCLAFQTTDRKKQIKIIENIKSENFFRITLTR